MLKGLVSIVVSILALGALALNPTHHLTASDVDRLQSVLEQPFTDLKSAYFSIVGLSKLGVSVPDSDVSLNKYHRDILQTHLFIACLLRVYPFYIFRLLAISLRLTWILQALNLCFMLLRPVECFPFVRYECKTKEVISYISRITFVWVPIFVFEFDVWQIHASNETRDLLLAAVSEDSTISQIHHAVSALSSLGLPLASQEVLSALKARIAKEDNVVAWVNAHLVLGY